MPATAGSLAASAAPAFESVAFVLKSAGISRICRRDPFARIDNESVGVDIAEPNEFLNRADGGWSIIMFARHFDQPIHSELRYHRRFQPRFLISRDDVLRCDLSC